MAILKDLIVHGSSRFLNKIYANELEVSAFEAESAIIKKLTAKDATLENATVIGLLDVQGQLHTNTWTNSNIATIDGCFYITPTLSSDSGKISFSSTSVASLTGSYSAVTSLYIGDSSSGSTVQWTSGSNVLLTGEVEVNGQWLPLGTLLGTLSANATTSSIGLTGLTDNRHNTSSIITDIRNAVSNASLNYRNLKISLYQRKDGTDSKPLGIYMTAMGTNGKTFIDIYGGVNSTTTAGSSGGFADPNLRIGNLSGLGAVEGTTPTGWGIYTTNGYFKGVIVSSAGKIGNFTINSALYSNGHSAWNSNVSGIYINNDGISGGAGGKWWLWNDGSAKIGEMTLSAAGSLTVPAASVSGKLTAATIDGTQITANTITAGQIAASAITADELAANAVTSAKIKAGEVKADNIAADAVTAAKINVDNLSAISASMGTLTSGTISYGTVGSNSSFYLSSSDTSATIAGASRTGLRLTVGSNFGVSNTGVLYASSAIISGNITATSGTIGGASITNGTLIVGNANIDNVNASKINAGDIAAARIQTNLISAINAKVSDISALTATLGGFQVDNTAIHTKNVEITSNADNSIALSSADFTRTINSTSRAGLRFAIGDKLGITGDGAIYASSATISGNITATSGTIGGASISDGILQITNTNISGTISANHIDASSLSIGISQVSNLQNTLDGKASTSAVTAAAGTASKYITAIDQNGIKVHAENNKDLNYTLINANGMSIYQNASGTAAKVADFNQNAVAFYDGNGDDDENIIALFGKDGGQVGYTSSNHLTFSSNSITAVSDTGANLFSVGSNQAKEETLVTKSIGVAEKITSTSSSNPTIISVRLPITDEVTGGLLKIDYEWYGYLSNQQNTFRHKGTFEGVTGTGSYEDVDGGYAHMHLAYSVFEAMGYQTFAASVYKTTSSYTISFRIISVTYNGYIVMPTYDFGTRAVSSNFAGSFSSVIGESLFATGDRQVAIGKYNIEDTNDTYAFIVGNGNDDDNRSNALTVDWSGNLITSGGAAFNGNTSITGSLNITGSITQNNKSLFKKEDVTVTVTYSAGTIGSRGGAISLGTTLKSGYTYLGAYIMNNQSTSSFSAIISRNDDTANAMLLVYRATSNAVSNAEIKVRKIWVLESLVTT